MHIDKWVKASVVVAIVMGVPGWIGVFSPSSVVPPRQQISNPAPSTGKDTPPNPSTELPKDLPMQRFLDVMRYVGPILSSGFLLLAVIITFRRRHETAKALEKTLEPELRIHSASYGTGSANDLSVTDFLKNSPREALSIWIGNNLIPGRPDPAPNLPKRLIVEYSYKNGQHEKVERSEHTQLVLPEDSWLKTEVQRISQQLSDERGHLAARVQDEKETLARVKQECARKIVEQQEACKIDLTQERNRKRPLVESAGALRSKAGQADWLRNRLEEIWHLYDADKHANEALLYPLSTTAIPDEIKEWRHKQLWAFRVLYQSHISAVKAIDPNFHSNLIDDGFPRDGERYLDIMRKIEAHATFLRDRADRLIRADAVGEAP